MENSVKYLDHECFLELIPDPFNGKVVTIQKRSNFDCTLVTNDYSLLRVLSEELSYESKAFRFRKNKVSKWDGKIRYFDARYKKYPIGFNKIVVKKLLSMGYSVLVDKQTKGTPFVTSSEEFQAVVDSWGIAEDKYPRDYQLMAAYESLRRNSILIMSITSSGKSLIIYLIMRYYLSQIDYKAKIMLVVPYANLVEQMIGDFQSYETDDYISQRVSRRLDDLDKNIYVTTYSFIEQMEDTAKRNYVLKSLDGLIIDEAHISGFDDFIRKCVNSKLVIGLTGTVKEIKENMFRIYNYFREAVEFNDYTEMKERGIVSEVIVNTIRIDYNKYIEKDYYEQFRKYSFMKQGIPSLEYDFESQAIFKTYNYKRNLICALARHFQNNNQNVMVIFYTGLDDIDSVYEYYSSFYNESKIIKVVGDVSASKREKIRAKIEESFGNVLICSPVFSTGTNIKNIHHIILARFGKSKNFTLQSIGRGMRKHESKDYIGVWDFEDVMPPLRNDGTDTCYSEKHFHERLRYYRQQGYKIISHKTDVKEIEDNLTNLVHDLTKYS